MAVSSGNTLVASASNDCSIRIVRRKNSQTWLEEITCEWGTC
jgi:hypothetical protein